MELMHHEDQGPIINDRITRAVLVEAKVAHSLEAEVLRVSTLEASLISIRVSIVCPFMLCFRFLTGVNLATIIILARVVICH